MKNGDNNTTSKAVTQAVVIVTSFLTPYLISAVNVALPTIGDEFKLDAVVLGWVPTSFLLVTAMFLVPFGRLADIYGRKKIYTYGVIITTVSTLLAGLSPSPLVFFICRVLQGFGGAMIAGTGIAILTSVFPASERGKVLGINVASVYIGLSVGPTLGGYLTQLLGWRSIFLVTVPLWLAAIIAIYWKLRGEWAEAKGERLDIIGSVIYALALVALMYGFSLLPEMLGFWLIVGGIAGIVIFVRWELRVSSPVLDINLFKNNTVFALSNLAALINYSATFAVSFLMSLFLQYIKGFSPIHAGLILVAMPVVQAVLSPFAGRLSDRLEPRLIASAGMALVTLGLFLFIFLSGKTSLAYILCTLFVLGLGFALFSSPNTNAVMGSVEKKFYGVASGTLSTMRTIGQMLSMGIAMLLLALFVGRVQITPEAYPSFLSSVRVAYIVFTVLCLGGVFASLARGKARE